MTTLALGPSWLDPDYLLDQFGIWGLLLIVFAESGLLIGFFLPGDSLLFTAGLLITAGTLDFPLWGAIALICAAAILGDQAGYMFGKKVGPSLFNRPDSRLFKQENVTKAHEFFEKYGPKSLVLARFVPIVRTFTPIIAGVSGMKYRSFLTFNVIGGVLWGAGVTLLGSWLGKSDFVKANIEPILLLIVLISVVPIIIEFARARSQAKKNPPQQPRLRRPSSSTRPRWTTRRPNSAASPRPSSRTITRSSSTARTSTTTSSPTTTSSLTLSSTPRATSRTSSSTRTTTAVTRKAEGSAALAPAAPAPCSDPGPRLERDVHRAPDPPTRPVRIEFSVQAAAAVSPRGRASSSGSGTSRARAWPGR